VVHPGDHRRAVGFVEEDGKRIVGGVIVDEHREGGCVVDDAPSPSWASFPASLSIASRVKVDMPVHDVSMMSSTLSRYSHGCRP